MIILVSKANKAVVDLTSGYDLDALKNNDTYITENIQGKHIEEPYVSDRFEIIDIPDDSPMLLDEHGNYKSFKPNYYLWVDNELVKNPRYIDEDMEALRKSKLNTVRSACHQVIINGFDYNGEHFSLSIEDQANIISNMGKAQLGIMTTYSFDGGDCLILEPEEMLKIGTLAETHKTKALVRHKKLKKWIKRETDLKTLNDITFDSELPYDLQDEMEDLFKSLKIKV